MPDNTVIHVKNLSKQFHGMEVLRDINLEIKRGEVVSILGSSGSGKSTLLSCMNWLEQPERGKIFVNNTRIGVNDDNSRPMTHNQLAKMREKIGMVFQNFNLWPHLTVQQNVMEALLHVKKAIPLCDEVRILDNSSSDRPFLLVASIIGGRVIHHIDVAPPWVNELVR